MNDSGEIFYDYIEDNVVNPENSFEKLPFEFTGNNEEWDKLSINEFWVWVFNLWFRGVEDNIKL